MQTCFQTFSCRQFSEAESYLDVDYQIGCHEDGYQRFRNTIGLLGVFVFPIGIPLLSLLLLLKNNSGIRANGPARDRYEFLVADYQVRKTPSWPRSWANFSLFCLYSHSG